MIGLTRIVCLLVLASSCEGDRSVGESSWQFAGRTTSGAIAVASLNGQIEGAQRQLAHAPENQATRERLIELLLLRTQFLGTFADFDRVFELLAEGERLRPGRLAFSRALALAAVHRFDEALQVLERGAAADPRGAQLRETVALARGRDLEPVLAARLRAASVDESYAGHAAVAAAQSARREYSAATASYRRAVAAYRDVSPFPVAWTAFQLGVMWGEAADRPDRALEYYQRAVERLPDYVTANVHLAELEFERGDRDAAIARLAAIVDRTADPEPASRLAEFLAERDPERARQYEVRARSGYERLLERYPLAFADHAAEFFMGAGDDPERAMQLAVLNLNNRATPRACALAMDAALSGERSLGPSGERLAEISAALARRCG